MKRHHTDYRHLGTCDLPGPWGRLPQRVDRGDPLARPKPWNSVTWGQQRETCDHGYVDCIPCGTAKLKLPDSPRCIAEITRYRAEHRCELADGHMGPHSSGVAGEWGRKPAPEKFNAASIKIFINGEELHGVSAQPIQNFPEPLKVGDEVELLHDWGPCPAGTLGWVTGNMGGPADVWFVVWEGGYTNYSDATKMRPVRWGLTAEEVRANPGREVVERGAGRRVHLTTYPNPIEMHGDSQVAIMLLGHCANLSELRWAQPEAPKLQSYEEAEPTWQATLRFRDADGLALVEAPGEWRKRDGHWENVEVLRLFGDATGTITRVELSDGVHSVVCTPELAGLRSTTMVIMHDEHVPPGGMRIPEPYQGKP